MGRFQSLGVITGKAVPDRERVETLFRELTAAFAEPRPTKDEIIAISRKIDTFETSIEPYEDCCTVFTPKHPKTKPRLDDVLKAEANMENLDEMMDRAVAGVKKVVIK